MKIATWCKNDMQKPALLGIPQCRQKLESDLIVDPQPLHFTSCTIQAQILGLVAVRSWLHLSLWCSVDFSQPQGKFTALTLSVTVIWIFLLGLASDRLCRCAKLRGNWWSETTFWVKHLKIIKTFWTMFPVKIWNSKRLFVLFLWGSSPSTLCDDADRKPKHERMQKMKSSHEKRNVTKSDKHPMCHPSCWSHTKVF